MVAPAPRKQPIRGLSCLFSPFCEGRSDIGRRDVTVNYNRFKLSIYAGWGAITAGLALAAAHS